MTQRDWTLMADPQQAELRWSLASGEIAEAMQAEIRVLHDGIAKIRQLLLIQGLGVTDIFHAMKHETAFSEEETLIAPRVRMDERRGTPNFYWERTIRHSYPLGASQAERRAGKTRTYQAFVRRQGSKTKTKMQVYLLSKHVPLLKKTQSVSMKEFSQEPEWVRTAAALIEPQLTELRRLATAIGTVNRSLCRFEQMLKKQTKEAQT